MGQRLPVAVLTQPGSHGFHRHTPPVQQQPPQIHLAPPALIRPRERLEHLRREVLKITPDRGQLPTLHTRSNGHATGERT
ncbi:hypothetical protein ACNJZD_00135 [Streptomyces ipomoeae]|nr:hypothetical protein [Streptomyces ipomoeae]MDX2939118.1 hypothetical protein [Streptomyces ipomoeae]